MKILFTAEAWKDFEWFLDNDKQLVKRIRKVPSTEVLIKVAELFDVSLDYLAFEAEDKPAKVEIKDRELLRRFEEIDKLGDKDKGTVKEILDTFILKNKFQKLAQANSA